MVSMAILHMSEAEVARDLHAALAQVQQGVEIVIEQDHRPVAVLKAQPKENIPGASRTGRPITEILREAKLRNSTVTLDEDFGKDLEEVVASHQLPWNPPTWD